ncbi:MAG: diacylglycerol kinase family lipid kinase [Lachnospiraceae bacterium]|nr:diacylglycerol kinase family lipid kinase [Lachnospiraceae bacterium]
MYHFIINPHSQSGKGYPIWLRLEKKLKRKNIEYTPHLTRYPGHARELAAALTTPSCDADKEERILIIMGGDGTLNEVIDGLTFRVPATVGYIPTGSGNDFARSMRLPKRPGQALKHILNPKYLPYIDYGTASFGRSDLTHRRFAVSCGIGLDADICQALFTSKLKEWTNRFYIGKFSYILVGIRQIARMQTCSGYLELDRSRRINLKRIAFISSHIQRYEGGGFLFSPQANAGDGLLDLCVIASTNRLKILPVLLASKFGRHCNMRGVHHYRCKEAFIHMDKPRHVHTDGEIFSPQTDLTLSCFERCLRIIL